jgi:3-dehydroquinate synthase
MKFQVDVQASKKYSVLIERGLIHSVSTITPTHSKVVILTDRLVPMQWVSSVIDQFDDPLLITVPEGESSKTLRRVELIVDEMLDAGCHRDTVLLALGGGVIGDLGGFVASVFMRGIPYVQIPTTLLAQIDSSVGGKVAVNTALAKNVIGGFYPPNVVCIDPDVLLTLPKEEFANGMAELIKYGLILDATLFELIENETILQQLPETIYRAVSLKKQVVEADERESHYRQILNFGHSIAHAIEKASNHSIPHGQAVAMGMAMMIQGKPFEERVLKVLKRYGLSTSYSENPVALIDYILKDKKASTDGISEIFVREIGSCEIEKISYESMKTILEGTR